jgi:hypothetical protein
MRGGERCITRCTKERFVVCGAVDGSRCLCRQIALSGFTCDARMKQDYFGGKETVSLCVFLAFILRKMQTEVVFLRKNHKDEYFITW